MRASVLYLLLPASIATYAGYVYYRMFWLRLQSKRALRHIDDQARRHHEMIPHLLHAMSNYAIRESQAFEHVVQARCRSLAAAGKAERMAASMHMSAALEHLFRITETCAEFKSDDEAMLIHAEVMRCEQKIELARDYYNHVVRLYNERIARFPHSLLAAIAGFRPETLYERSTIREAPWHPVRQPVD